MSNLRVARDLPIAGRLVILVLSAVLSILCFSSFMMLRFAQAEREALEDEARLEISVLAADIERALTDLVRSTRMLALVSYRLRQGELDAFYGQAQQAAKLENAEILLSDASGRQILNVSRPFGTPLPMLTDPLRPARAFEEGPRVTGLTSSAVADQLVVGIDVPVQEAVGGPYLLSFNLRPDYFQRILATRAVPSGWFGTIYDSEGRIVARTVDPEKHVGRGAYPAFWAKLTGPSGTYSSLSRDGIRVVGSYIRLPGSGWVVALGVPEAEIAAPLRASLTLIALGGLALVLLTAMVAWMASRIVARPLTALSDAAHAIGRGERPRMPPPGIREVTAVGRALEDAHRALQIKEAERAQAERRSIASDTQRREALEAAEVGTWSIDLSSGRWAWDGNCRRLFGFPAGAGDEEADAATEILVQQLLPQEELRKFAELMDDLRRGQHTVSVEFQVIWTDGSRHWLRTRGSVVPPGDVCKGALVNIDEIKQREKDLLESEDRYRAIVETAIDSMVVIDERGIIQSFNRAAEVAFGYDRAEVIGRNVAILLPPAERAGHDGHLTRYLQTGTARIIGIGGREVQAARKDGSLFPVQLSIAEW